MDIEIHKLGLKYKFFYSMGGLFLGFCSVVVGALLALTGAIGKTSIIANLVGLEASMTDAPPGVVLFLIGLCMVWATKFSVKHEYSTSEASPAVLVPSSTSATKITLPAENPPAIAMTTPAQQVLASPPLFDPPVPTPKGRTGKSSSNLTMRETDAFSRVTNERIHYKISGGPYASKGAGSAKAAAKAAKPAKPAAKAPSKPTEKVVAKSVGKKAALRAKR